MNKQNNSTLRSGIQDIWWNAFMVKGANWDKYKIPFCSSIKDEIPKSIITWSEAVTIYNKFSKSNLNFKSKHYVCFYQDDQKFDGIRKGIWFNPQNALKILKHFAGIITPDFSTYKDFPFFLTGWNTYRMRAFGYWCNKNGINAINNVRWNKNTLDYCFNGIPKHSIICIGTVASRLKYIKNRSDFELYFMKMIEAIEPKIILVYGSSKYNFFNSLWTSGIEIIQYPSRRNRKKEGTENE